MMQAKTTWIVAVAGTMLGAGVVAQPQEHKPELSGMRQESATLNFDKDQVGKLPAGWKAAAAPGSGAPAADPPGVPGKPAAPGKSIGAPAVWAVAADPTAPTSPNVLEVMGSTQGVNGYNICICENHSHKDVELTAKVRGNTGKVEQGGGVAWRVRNPENFYACAYNPSDGKFSLFKVVDGRTQELGTANFKGSGPDASTWYTIRAQMHGDTIACSINGQELLHATDTALKDTGHIGLWTRGDASTSFDDLTIRNAGEPGKDSKEMPPSKEPPRPIPPKTPPAKGG